MSGLRDPRLASVAPSHAFGTRELAEPPGLLRPLQAHGKRVVRAETFPEAPPEADAIVSARPGVAVGVITADCVPLLLAAPGASAVAAVHAGWRGLAAGVIEAAVAALAQEAALAPEQLVAAIGPHVGPCCYEVDRAVCDPLEGAYGAVLRGALEASRPGHMWLDLGTLAVGALLGAGLRAEAIGRETAQCTACDAQRFHSYRRDGAGAGRLVHFIAAESQA